LGPEYPDVSLETVVAIIQNLEKSGTIEILRPKAGKTGIE